MAKLCIILSIIISCQLLLAQGKALDLTQKELAELLGKQPLQKELSDLTEEDSGEHLDRWTLFKTRLLLSLVTNFLDDLLGYLEKHLQEPELLSPPLDLNRHGLPLDLEDNDEKEDALLLSHDAVELRQGPDGDDDPHNLEDSDENPVDDRLGSDNDDDDKESAASESEEDLKLLLSNASDSLLKGLHSLLRDALPLKK